MAHAHFGADIVLETAFHGNQLAVAGAAGGVVFGVDRLSHQASFIVYFVTKFSTRLDAAFA